MSTATAVARTRAGTRWDFRRLAAAVCLSLLLATMWPAASGLPVAGSSATSIDVIVRGAPAAGTSVAAAIAAVGGSVLRSLPILDGASARIPSSAIEALRSAPGVVTVTPDRPARPLGHAAPDATVGGQLGSLPAVADMVGAPQVWRQGVTGAGVDVAVIDTGVVGVEGLTVPGKVVNGPDLSFESQIDALRYLDTNGHGTAMASIIAGRDEAVADPAAPGPHFQGIAPDARLLSIKVGASDGAVDVSQVIAAVDWVVQHRNTDGLNIRVLNLSYGTDSVQRWSADPLAYAVDVAWRSGIVVVVSAGNDGRNTRLAMPAANPNIIAVGASDHAGTADVADDHAADFSTYARGPRRVDLLAPGVKVLGLRNPGSMLDETYPEAVFGGRYFRGSGTSQSAAVVSGVSALLLSQRPALTPDEVKSLLRSTARELPASSSSEQGAGLVDVAAAAAAAVRPAQVHLRPAAGTGSIDATRGSHRLESDGVVLSGEQDIFGRPFDSAVWAPLASAGSSWTGGDWNGSTWTGSSWGGSSWAGSSWKGSSWKGSSWGGSSWGGSSWKGPSWYGSSWGGSSWKGSSWKGSSWKGSSWGGSSWGGSSWKGSSWGGSSWGTDAWS